MRLQRVLLISAILGATLPLASFILWFALNFGDLWAAVHRHWAALWPSHPVFGSELLIDLILGAVLNVPLYMVVGTGLWLIFGRKRTAHQLR
jgi:hypothetical protein